MCRMGLVSGVLIQKYLLRLTTSRIAANTAWVWKLNRDKASGKNAAWEGKGDDRDPDFKMVL